MIQRLPRFPTTQLLDLDVVDETQTRRWLIHRHSRPHEILMKSLLENGKVSSIVPPSDWSL
ncbi:uncharacterized protein LACBIDRAFT_300480 [Laccaria bicolor S238N-H82]|uniref:Predicted protein n=1 Tax=Laccaria bicolor (strain S238N-H82 / ATCC MYA-4686) TaxID=486041 RepID=B0DGV8_LACBS|nr:uncharacterized protein LACBIDRAFT_300480 [Laccaria bicolor S238N-H82]EDR06342.1 predicted protein [Laccaria bicolor S238N-H82]|eukprot:XP_001883203.1 predicted protein [Laccaria bicolor S238N-H82]